MSCQTIFSRFSWFYKGIDQLNLYHFVMMQWILTL